MTNKYIADDSNKSESDEGADERRTIKQHDNMGADFDQEKYDRSQGINKKKPGVLKSSFAAAFQSIINKKIDETKSAEPILAKYKRPSKEVTQENLKEAELRKKRLEKEKIRLMGRHIPTADDEEHERELAIIATRGVVQLFNTVSEFQLQQHKDAV